MPIEELRRALPCHVTGQCSSGRLAQIDQNETVECVRKPGVDVEGEHAPAEFHVLADEDRHSFAVRLEVGDGVGQVLQVAQQPRQHARVPIPSAT